MVSGVLGVWMETKSASPTSSSMVTSRTPMALARSGETKGSKPISSMPKAWARWATSEPARPSPTTPSTLPWSSTPSHFERSHRPATSEAWAWGMLRAWASSSAMACSATERMLEVGALTTMTPRAVAAATSTLSRPTPARPTTCERGAGLEHLGGHLGGGADDEGLRPDDGAQQLLGAQPLLDVDLMAGLGQQVEAALGDLLGYQYSCHRSGLLTTPLDVVLAQSCASAKKVARRDTPSTRSSSPRA